MRRGVTPGVEVADPGVDLEGAVVGLEGGMAVGGRTVVGLAVEGKVVVEADLALEEKVVVALVAAMQGGVGAGASTETIKTLSRTT